MRCPPRSSPFLSVDRGFLASWLPPVTSVSPLERYRHRWQSSVELASDVALPNHPPLPSHLPNSTTASRLPLPPSDKQIVPSLPRIGTYLYMYDARY